VLDDNGYNAFAAPGGYVFVTKGLVDRVADESELAGILAHEITHVVQRHHLQAMRKTARAGALTQVIGSAARTTTWGAHLSAQLLNLGRNLYAKGLDQEDEFDADRQGVALASPRRSNHHTSSATRAPPRQHWSRGSAASPVPGPPWPGS
jgi:predicted Zn-dependent protease